MASNSFGLDLYRSIAQRNDGQEPRENVFLSPYGIAVTLAMVHQGAKGQTAEQLNRVLRLEKISNQVNTQSQDEVANVVAKAVHNVSEQLYQVDPSNQFDYGNVMVVDQSIRVKDQYVQNVRQYYQGEVIPGDFKNDGQGIMTRVNQYVANKTHGLVDPMLEQPPSQDGRMALVNAVYFKGQWAKKFQPEQTETGVFYGANGQQYQGVQYMKSEGQYPHVELPGLDADLVLIKYKGEDVAFVGVLPRSRDADLKTIREALNATYIDQLIGQTISYQQSQVVLPRMEVTARYDLPEHLKQLGIQNVFTESSELSGISEQEKLRITHAIHKAKLVINEQGTEAGAGTYVEIAVLALPTEPSTFRFDHPFIYFIRHQQTGQILFLGEVHQF